MNDLQVAKSLASEMGNSAGWQASHKIGPVLGSDFVASFDHLTGTRVSARMFESCEGGQRGLVVSVLLGKAYSDWGSRQEQKEGFTQIPYQIPRYGCHAKSDDPEPRNPKRLDLRVF